jgi:GH15 family glucan-1,4-alpha-glucosidase
MPASTSSEPTGRDSDGYCDLRSYAAIGDGRTIAMIALDGRIDWLPLPDMDSNPAFAALLDAEHGGYLALCPEQPFTVSRNYIQGTNVLSTTFETSSGAVTVTDSLNTGVAGRLPWAELARRIEGVRGSVPMRAVLRLGSCLNTASPWIQSTEQGPILRVDGLTMSVIVLDETEISHTDKEVSVRFRTSEGSRQLFALVATEREPLFLPAADDIDRGIDRTVRNWQNWSEVFHWGGPWEQAVHRSALALKLLLYSPSGALMAAATTSLPENPSGGKNWDYRYAWIRDMAYSIKALFRFGLREETHAAISWLLHTIREHGPEPEVFYDLTGSQPAGRTRSDVPGWRGIGPVLSGNAASSQLQLGVYGDLFSIVRLYVDNGNVLDAETGRLLASIADLACDRWISPDAGMWELPEERHYVSSKLGCWQALTDAVHLANIGQIPGDPSRWRTEAEHIRSWVDEHGWSSTRGAYIWYPGSNKLDASILLHAISGFDRGPRMSATLDALRAELGAGPHLYRYSGMAKEEGTFVACAFWLASALHLVGRVAEASKLMDELVDSANDVGIFAEQIDAATDAFLGNLPQALSHLALINAAITLSAEPAS